MASIVVLQPLFQVMGFVPNLPRSLSRYYTPRIIHIRVVNELEKKLV